MSAECIRMWIKSTPWKFRPINYSPLNQAGLTRRPWRLSGRSWRMSDTQQMSPIHDTYVCVCHLYGCKTSLCCRGVWHSRPTTRNEAVDMSGQGNVAGFLYLLYIYNYINALNIFHRAWGTYIVLLLVYTVWSTSTVILRLYNIYIYVCILYVNLVFLLLVFLHVRCIPQTGFVTTVLSKCVTHAGFVMVAWTLWGIPFQVGNLSLRSDLWIYIFQPSNSFK